MMLIRRAATAALVLAITAAGCSGGGAQAPQPLGAVQPSSGVATLGATTNPTETLTGPATGTVTYPTGTGTISASDSTSAPTGVTALTSVARAAASGTVSTKDDPTDPQTPLLYITYTAQSAVTLAGIPGVSVTLPTAPTSDSVYEAVYSASAGVWYAVGPVGGVNGASVTFPVVTPYARTRASGESFYVVIYAGTKLPASPSPSPSPTASPTPAGPTPTPSPSPVPTATPTPTPVPTATPIGATPTPTPTPNAVRDSGFESGSAAAYGGAPTTTGWTQCTIPGANVPTSGTPVVFGTPPGASTTAPATPHPVGTMSSGGFYTPIPQTSPAAVIDASGTTLQTPAPFATGTGTPIPVATPVPTQSTVIVNSGSYAAVFGQVFDNYNAGDFYYNGLCQNVTVPAGAPTLNFSLFGNSNESSTYVDFDVVLLDPTSGAWDAWLYDEAQQTGSAYHTATVPMTAYAGSTYTLFMGMWTKSGSTKMQTTYSGYYFLDDVSLAVPLNGGSSIKRAPMTVPTVRKK